MKILFGILLFFLSFISSYGFENTGFTTYNELSDGLSFNCEGNCLIDLGFREKNEKINFSGSFQGNGVYGIGLLNESNFISMENFNISSDLNVIENIDLFNNPYFSIVTEDTKIVFYISGNIKTNNFNISGSDTGLFYKVFSGLKNSELLTPYSINLRYGSNILGVSIVKILYLTFFIFIFVLYFLKDLNKDDYLNLVIIFILVLSVKNIYDYYKIYNVGELELSKGVDGNFYNMGNYFNFTDQIRDNIGIDEIIEENKCSYYSECYSDWPFCYYWRSVFLKPCLNTENSEESDYIILYKKDIPDIFKNKEVIYSEDNSYLLKN